MSTFPPYEPTPPPVQEPGGTPPPRGKGRGVLIAIILGLCLTGVFVCCGGLAALMNFGFNIIEVEIQDELAGTPEFQEHVGTIESFEMNWTRSFADDDDDAFVYDVEGSNGSGRVRVEHYTDDDGMEVIEAAELTLSDGRKIPVSISP